MPGTHKGWLPIKKAGSNFRTRRHEGFDCPNCGQTRVIPRAEAHEDCGISGDRIRSEGQ